MVLDLLDPETLMRLLGVFGLMILGACYGYVKGFKDGKREGLAVGKNYQQVAPKRDIYAVPADVIELKNAR